VPVHLAKQAPALPDGVRIGACEPVLLRAHERPQPRVHVAQPRLGPVSIREIDDEGSVTSLRSKVGQPPLEPGNEVDGDLDPAEERADVLGRLVPSLGVAAPSKHRHVRREYRDDDAVDLARGQPPAERHAVVRGVSAVDDPDLAPRECAIDDRERRRPRDPLAPADAVTADPVLDRLGVVMGQLGSLAERDEERGRPGRIGQVGVDEESKPGEPSRRILRRRCRARRVGGGSCSVDHGSSLASQPIIAPSPDPPTGPKRSWRGAEPPPVGATGRTARSSVPDGP
jgi:hypothetical protein